RRLLFGERLDAVTDCPRCDTPIEFDVPVQDLLALQEPASTPPRVLDGPRGALELKPVTAADVLAALSSEAPEREVVRPCVPPPLVDDELTDEMVTTISERLPALDPLADLNIDLVCPECTAPCQLGLDVGTFLWDELSSWAWRTFGDINDLARAYGW